MHTTRRNRRAIYRALVTLDGWVSTAETIGAAERLATMSPGSWDRRSDIFVAALTRRTITLEAR